MGESIPRRRRRRRRLYQRNLDKSGEDLYPHGVVLRRDDLGGHPEAHLRAQSTHHHPNHPTTTRATIEKRRERERRLVLGEDIN